ncbi:hypothetical protein D3C78_1498940 [compost metagenome]
MPLSARKACRRVCARAMLTALCRRWRASLSNCAGKLRLGPWCGLSSRVAANSALRRTWARGSLLAASSVLPGNCACRAAWKNWLESLALGTSSTRRRAGGRSCR